MQYLTQYLMQYLAQYVTVLLRGLPILYQALCGARRGRVMQYLTQYLTWPPRGARNQVRYWVPRRGLLGHWVRYRVRYCTPRAVCRMQYDSTQYLPQYFIRPPRDARRAAQGPFGVVGEVLGEVLREALHSELHAVPHPVSTPPGPRAARGARRVGAC